MSLKEIMKKLKSFSDPKAVAGMARYGINPNRALGVSIPVLRGIAKQTGKNHPLANGLWRTGIHEARILAGMIADPDKLSSRQMDLWAGAFDSWDVCDQCCLNLFEKKKEAYAKAKQWSKRKEEFVKRAGFTLMARLAVSDKKMDDVVFMDFFPFIKKESGDERNYVKKAVNWALRQIGKRSRYLNRSAIKLAKEIQAMDSSSSRWIANDALRELTSEAVRKRIKK